MTKRAPVTVDDVREHLEAQLARALLLPGMYGDEVVLRHMMETLIWVHGLDVRTSDFFEAHGAWSPIGVAGAFTRIFGGHPTDNLDAMALVYADLAWSIGCWAPERTVDAETYDLIRSTGSSWASADRQPADVMAEFGTPSIWRETYNSWFPTSFGYVPEDRTLPIIAFDFFPLVPLQRGARRTEDQEPSPLMLRNIRWRTNSLPDDIICTPFGAGLRQAERQVAAELCGGD